MDIFTYIYIISSLGIAILLEGAVIYSKSRQTQHSEQSILQDSYIRQIVAMLFAEEAGEIFPHADTAQRRQALAEALYSVMSHSYGSDTATIRELIERTQLDKYILTKIRHSKNIERAHYLMLMSAIPTSIPIIPILRPYLYSRYSHTRTAALLAILAASPSTAISTITSLSYDLTGFDIARIITLLRRGILPIAYEPLLSSQNRNLQMLGLAIVRNFGIEIADKHLQHIISSSADYAVTREALYTLSSLGRPLGRVKIRQRIASMPQHHRKELCRHLTHAGYSLAALRTIFDQNEIQHTESIIKSYKRSLECSYTSNI